MIYCITLHSWVTVTTVDTVFWPRFVVQSVCKENYSEISTWIWGWARCSVK